MSCNEVKTDILYITLQDGPLDLQPAAFGLTSACANGIVLRTAVDNKIMKLAYLTICKTLFIELCPDYSDQPHVALNLIKQVSVDHDGNQVVASVYTYHTRLMNAARPFTTEIFYPISLCTKFMEGMDPRLFAGFRRNFPTHSTVEMLHADIQRKKLQEMLVAAQRAKDDLASVQRAAREAVGLLQSFFMRGKAQSASAFPSQAETTLTKYSSTGGSCVERRPINCFCCGGPHPWSEFIDGKHVVKCPNRSNPGVADNVTKALERHCAN
jgi:hypothetical protein